MVQAPFPGHRPPVAGVAAGYPASGSRQGGRACFDCTLIGGCRRLVPFDDPAPVAPDLIVHGVRG